MLRCPRHRDVALTDSGAGLICFLCARALDPLELASADGRVLALRAKPPARVGRRSVEAAQRQLDAQPQNRQRVLRLADLLDRAGRATEAAGYFQQVGDTFLEEGARLHAVATYKYVLELDPQRGDANRGLARAYLELGLVRDAEAALTPLWSRLRQQGELARAYQTLAELRGIQPDFAPQEAGWARAWPGQRRVLALLPTVESQAGPVRSAAALDACLRDLEWVAQLGSPKPKQVVPWAQVYLGPRTARPALEQLGQAVAASVGSRPLRLLWALALDRAGEPAEAGRRYAELLAHLTDERHRALRAELTARRQGGRPSMMV